MAEQNPNNNSKILDYVLNIEMPLELHFLGDKEQEKIKAVRQKYEKTVQYINTYLEHPDMKMDIQKEVFNRNIYSAPEATKADRTLQALEGSGHRIDLRASLVHSSGNYIILSEKLAKELGYLADTYATSTDLPALLDGLKAEGVEEALLNKVKESVATNGAVILQRGAYSELANYLESATGKALARQMGAPASKPASAPGAEHGTSLNQLKHTVQNAKPTASKVPTPPVPRKEINIPTTNKLPDSPGASVGPKIPDKTNSWVKEVDKPNLAHGPAQAHKIVKLNDQPSLGLASVKDINVIDDLTKLEAAHLRQGYTPDQINLIRSRVAYLAGANSMLPVQVVNIFEQSPLFKLYLEIGSLIMSKTTGQSKPNYNQLMNERIDQGKEVLSIQEFEAMADLRKALESM